METFISDIKNKFLYGDTLARLILINVGVFVVIAIIKVFFILLGLTDNATWNHNFEWSWNLEDFLARPWTIATYMFTSYGVWHLLFNMLTLYWFGQRFQTLFTNSQLRGIYILGALAGMVFFTLIFNLFPAMQTKDYLWTMPGTSTAENSAYRIYPCQIPCYCIGNCKHCTYTEYKSRHRFCTSGSRTAGIFICIFPQTRHRYNQTYNIYCRMDRQTI